MKRLCPNGHEVSDNVKYCPTCGAEIISGKKFCTKCGSERMGTEKFCSQCGTPFDNVQYSDSFNNMEETTSRFKKYLPYFLGAIALVAICGGGLYYMNTKGILSKSEAFDVNNELLSMEEVFDIYQSKDKDHIRQVLKERGYSLFKTNDEDEHWTKNVQLKEVKNWKDEIIYEPTERKGGSVTISGSDDYHYVIISVYSDNDFKNWEKQLLKMGFKETKYGDDLPEEDGWTALGAHANLCKLYKNSSGKSIEFMKDGDGHLGYDVCSIEESNQELDMSSDNTPIEEIEVVGEPTEEIECAGDAIDAAKSAIDESESNKSYNSGYEEESQSSSDDNSFMSTNTSSSRTFNSEQIVVGYLANQSFRESDGLTMKIDGSGRLYIDGNYAGVLSVLRYNSTSALLRYGGGMYDEGKIRVDIVGSKLQLTDPTDGTVYYQR